MGDSLFTNLIISAAVIQVLYLLYITIYRLVFHPLASIPGPKLAALTSWYECYYDVVKHGQYVFKIKELHKQYGPVLRITPREIHIDDIHFLDQIYSPGSGDKRDKDAPKSAGLKVNQSVGGAIGSELHRQRREALNPFFSQRRVMELEAVIRKKLEQLYKTVDDSMERGTVLNLSDAYFAFALDVVSRYCFGADDDVVGDTVRASILRNNLSRMLQGVKFNYHFGWIRGLIPLLPKAVGKHLVPAGVMDMLDFRKKIRCNIKEVLEDLDMESQNHEGSIFQSLLKNPLLLQKEKSLQRLEDEAALLVMAGTESPAKSMTIAHYYLLANPQILGTLRSELNRLPRTASLTDLLQLPYLSAIIAESNRLSFGITGRNCRVAPDETLSYRGHTIPSGTPLSMTSLCVHTTEEIFTDPWTFDPTRWIGKEGAQRRKYQFAFGKGPRKCVGINLAHAELCLSIAALARYEMELFETTDSDVQFRHDYHVAHAQLNSKGVRCLVRGRA